MNDFAAILLVIFLLMSVITIFIKISMFVRKGGGSMTTVILGATDEFYNREKKKAVEMIVEQNAHKKLEEQSDTE